MGCSSSSGQNVQDAEKVTASIILLNLRDFFVQRFVPINADKKNKKVSSKGDLVTSKADFVMTN